MVNDNGTVKESGSSQLDLNRGFLYGDGVFETAKICNGKVLFLEDHYFRLMSAMRIVRMEIPMNFTMEFLAEEILRTATASNCSDSCRARITVYRNGEGAYLPKSRQVNYYITVSALERKHYLPASSYEVDLYKDFYVPAQLLSTVKTMNRIINVTGSIYADENGLDNCLLINEKKNVVEALQGNIFMLTGEILTTPPLNEGCVNGVMRKQILELSRKIAGLQVQEVPVSPFDLQKADELFISNVIIGVQPVIKYRKKEFVTNFSLAVLSKINEMLVE